MLIPIPKGPMQSSGRPRKVGIFIMHSASHQSWKCYISEHVYHGYKQSGFTRKKTRFTLETDQTLFEPTASYDGGIPNEVESSEGEDWDNTDTLVSKFMEIDPGQVLFFISRNDAF
jgi:hypothetical protein